MRPPRVVALLFQGRACRVVSLGPNLLLRRKILGAAHEPDREKDRITTFRSWRTELPRTDRRKAAHLRVRPPSRSAPPPGDPKSPALPEPHQVPVFDGRSVSNSFSLDREGFALVRHPTSVRDFYSDKEIRQGYYPAAEAFITTTMRADRVVIFDHTVRRRGEGAADIRGGGPRQPGTRGRGGQ